MPTHVKRIECCYCAASSLINLSNPHEMHLVCSGCGARMSIDKMAPLALGAAAEPPKREITFEPAPDSPSKRSKARHSGGSGGSGSGSGSGGKKIGKGHRKKRRSFMKRLEDIWDEVEDIFD